MFKGFFGRIAGGAQAQELDDVMSAQDAGKHDEQAANQNESLSLTFEAVVSAGEGRFSRMIFPSRQELEGAPKAWPEKIQPGSMNCVITKFPENFAAVAGAGDRIAAFDTGHFTPELTIPREMIENNVVRPWGSEDNQRKGMAQVWRVAVENMDSGETFDALHVRRVDGTYPPFHGIMELMADRKLRDTHGLEDGTRLKITMYKKGAAPAR